VQRNPVLVAAVASLAAGLLAMSHLAGAAPGMSSEPDPRATSGLVAEADKNPSEDPDAARMMSTTAQECLEKTEETLPELEATEALAACLSQGALEVAELLGIKQAVTSTVDSVSMHPRLRPVCHATLHKVGEGAWQQYGPDSLKDLDLGHCFLGYYHGVTIASALTLPEQQHRELIGVTCEKLQAPEDGDTESVEQKVSDARSLCFHGIGHVLVNSEMPQQELFDVCATYSIKFGCISGAVMQMWEKSKFSKTASVEQLVNFCAPARSAQDTQTWDACVSEMLRLSMAYVPGTESRVAQFCESNKWGTAARCWRAMGQFLGSRFGIWPEGDVRRGDVIALAQRFCRESACTDIFGLFAASSVGADAAQDACRQLVRGQRGCIDGIEGPRQGSPKSVS
jgi:hypothetical protein